MNSFYGFSPVSYRAASYGSAYGTAEGYGQGLPAPSGQGSCGACDGFSQAHPWPPATPVSYPPAYGHPFRGGPRRTRRGGSGDSHIRMGGSYRTNRAYGRRGDDTLVMGGYANDNRAFGGRGDDRLVLRGVENNNRAFGGRGDDWFHLRGRGNTNVARGGAGNDVFRVSARNSRNVVFGGEGNDVLKLRGAAADWRETLTDGKRVLVNDKIGTTVEAHGIEKIRFV